ncbi:MAG: hypothetical protein RL404_2876, partial [Pseudomonadota bacterium]
SDAIVRIKGNKASGDAPPDILADLSVKVGVEGLGSAAEARSVKLAFERDDTKSRPRHSETISLSWRLKARFNAAFGFDGFNSASAKRS